MEIICFLLFDPNGSLESGYDFVTVRIENSNGDKLFQGVGKLSRRPKIAKLRREWSSTISQAARSLQIDSRTSPMRSIQPEENSYTASEYKERVNELLKKLEIEINNWFYSKYFREIRDNILSCCAASEYSKFIIETEDIELQRLPWNLWDCSKQQTNQIAPPEVAISSTRYKKQYSKNNFKRKKVRVLSILGDSSGIDLTKDREILEQSINADVEFLVEPSREMLFQYITDSKGWDILFFAGHSISQQDGKNGELFINKKDRLKVSELEGVLRDAITRGLTLAIFNSCDGIGIANNLASLDIPHVIVMREPVPDVVAQEFFKALISEFNHNQQYIALAIAKARQRLLHYLEYKCPGASSLPLLFHNASETTLTWNKLPAIKNKARIIQVEQPQLEIPSLDLDLINIAFIGDRASGKTTYIASLILNPNYRASKIDYKIDILNQNALELEKLAIRQIEKGEPFKPKQSEICDYQLKIMLRKPPSLWKQLFSYQPQSVELNLKYFNGQLFNSLDQLDEDNTFYIQNYSQSWTRSTGIIMAIAITEYQKDIEYERKIKKLLSILEKEQSNSKCQRIAVVLTKCDRSETFASYKSLTPQELAEKYFPRVSYKLQSWEEISGRKLGYFATSAFGFSDTSKSKANVQNNSGEDVLDRIQCWQPVNLLAPIYWLANGDRLPF